MKICQKCKQTYTDETLNFCLNDGTVLVFVNDSQQNFASGSGPTNPILVSPTDKPTEPYIKVSTNPYQQPNFQSNETIVPAKKSNSLLWILGILGAVIFGCGGLTGLLVYFGSGDEKASNSYSENIEKRSNSSRSNSSSEPSNDYSGSNTSSDSGTSSGKLTMSQYLKLEPGISYKEARDILGKDGEEMSSQDSGGTKGGIYKWQSSISEFIILLFVDDKLNSRSQSGLSKRETANLSMEKYNQLKEGMTYEEAVKVLGEGDEQNYTNIIGMKMVTYQWKSGNSSITLGFQNDKLKNKNQFGIK